VQDADADTRGSDTVPASDIAPAPDLEYDLAHESVPDAAGAASPVPAQEQLVLVATQTRGYDGDYSYDLAHDVPGR